MTAWQSGDSAMIGYTLDSESMPTSMRPDGLSKVSKKVARNMGGL